MEKSIENIWKEGFGTDKSFELPVIRNLYNKKSKLIIDKVRTTSKKDNIGLIPIAIVLFALLAFFNKLVLGIYVSSLLSMLFILNTRKLKDLDRLDLGSNTYLYVVNYQRELKGLQSFYTKLLGIGLPLAVIPGYWLFFQETPVMDSFQSLDMSIQGMILAATAVILSGIGVLSYRLSIHFLYGKLMTRLEVIISDMEEFMKN